MRDRWTIVAKHEDGDDEEYDDLTPQEAIDFMDGLARDKGVVLIYLAREGE